MAAIGFNSKEPYDVLIQRALDFYSQAAPVLEETMKKMDACKGEWGRNSIDRTIIDSEERTKAKLISTSLFQYHTFLKTKELAYKLFDTLNNACIETKRPEVSEDADETMARLKLDVGTFRGRRKALATLAGHLDVLANRTLTIFKQKMDVRLPQIEGPLDQFIGSMHPNLTGWGFYSALGVKPALKQMYADWLQNAPEEVKNWNPSLQTQPAENVSSDSENPNFKQLDKALKVLDLTYIDPQTNKRYGKETGQREESAPCCDSPDRSLSTMQEPQESKIEAANEEKLQLLDASEEANVQIVAVASGEATNHTSVA